MTIVQKLGFRRTPGKPTWTRKAPKPGTSRRRPTARNHCTTTAPYGRRGERRENPKFTQCKRSLTLSAFNKLLGECVQREKKRICTQKHQGTPARVVSRGDHEVSPSRRWPHVQPPELPQSHPPAPVATGLPSPDPYLPAGAARGLRGAAAGLGSPPPAAPHVGDPPPPGGLGGTPWGSPGGSQPHSRPLRLLLRAPGSPDAQLEAEEESSREQAEAESRAPPQRPLRGHRGPAAGLMPPAPWGSAEPRPERGRPGRGRHGPSDPGPQPSVLSPQPSNLAPRPLWVLVGQCWQGEARWQRAGGCREEPAAA